MTHTRMADAIGLTTALHEAGHAVAHVRLEIQQAGASILRRNDGTLGHVQAEGVEHVWSRKEAEPMVLAYCAGYAALMAAGHDESEAARGADDDFDHAQHLIEFWGLDDDLAHWQRRAVDLMSEPKNIAAVRLIADRLMHDKEIDADMLYNLVALADGETSEAEFLQYLQLRAI